MTSWMRLITETTPRPASAALSCSAGSPWPGPGKSTMRSPESPNPPYGPPLAGQRANPPLMAGYMKSRQRAINRRLEEQVARPQLEGRPVDGRLAVRRAVAAEDAVL